MIPEPTQTPLKEVEAGRLSLIRYQLLAATEATAAPPPISTLAINAMQDAVEATLWASGERTLADIPKRADFEKLFDAVCAQLGKPEEISGLRSAAIAMNNARVGFKHHGNQVPEATLRRHLDVSVSLVDALVVQAFGIQLSDVSMLLFVRDQQARSLVEEAEQKKDAGDLVEALFRLRLAFDRVVYDYERRMTYGWQSIFTTKPSFFPSKPELRKAGLQKIAEWIENIDEVVRLGALGVDFRRYAYFNAVAPEAMRAAGHYDSPEPLVKFEEVTIEHYNASYRFVVDTAIQLAAADYTIRLTTLGS